MRQILMGRLGRVFLDLTAASCFDYMEQLSGLLRDPLCYGSDVPHGNGEPILLIPGFFAGDWSMAPMARWLKRVGYRPYHSGIDLNLGCPREKVERLHWRVKAIVDETGMALTLIGHSLGGLLARSLSSSMPFMIGQVIVLGSPVRNEWAAVNRQLRPVMRIMAGWWQHVAGASACGTSDCACGFAATLRMRGDAACTSIYTREDELVDWRTCVGGGVSHEVSGRHFGLVVNREVYR
ncbi:MAG: esterase/lipase family protein, partial [Candidatus Binataceae bacterium]